MAPLLPYFRFRKVLFFYLVLFVFASYLFCACSSETQIRTQQFLGRRILDVENEELPKKKSSNLSTKNQTKIIKPNLSNKNQTKLIKKVTNSTKSASNSTTSLAKIELKKLNSTSKPTKPTSDPFSLSSPKNKTSKPTSTNSINSTKKTQILESEKPKKLNQEAEKKPKSQNTQKKHTQPSWIDQDEDDDLVAGFRDLPNKFQKTLIPDLERISTTSRAYITKANKEFTKNFKPIVGTKYASTMASIISFAFILIPLLLVSLIVNKIKAYFSLQKLLIFIQVYLSIYFTILCFSSLATGLEPLKFLYATSQSTYICLQVLQTLGYVFYLLLLLMYLVLVFSTECGLGLKMLGLGQTFVGFAVGLHYYVAVFHRVVQRQPPRTNWKVHGIYAACFLAVCLCATAERRKKAYLEEGGEEGKKS